MKVDVCPRCNGGKYDPVQHPILCVMVKCTRCNGTGIVLARTDGSF